MKGIAEKTTKKFGGKIFHLIGYQVNKTTAEQLFSKYRKMGAMARQVRDGSRWNVWYRFDKRAPGAP